MSWPPQETRESQTHQAPNPVSALLLLQCSEPVSRDEVITGAKGGTEPPVAAFPTAGLWGHGCKGIDSRVLGLRLLHQDRWWARSSPKLSEPASSPSTAAFPVATFAVGSTDESALEENTVMNTIQLIQDMT